MTRTSISQEAAAIARRHDLREGIAEFKGNGHWSTELSSLRSGSRWRPARSGLAGRSDRVKKASATADYSVTDQQIKLSKLQGRLLGGSVAGDAQVDNWLHSIPLPSRRAK